jgi:SAM-dependent methyltransferase
VAGVDSSLVATETAREKYGLQQVFCGRLENVFSCDDLFDAVTILDTLQLVPGLALVEEAKFRLRKGGILVVKMTMRNVPFVRAVDRLASIIPFRGQRLLHIPTTLYHMDAAWLQSYLEARGWRCIAVHMVECQQLRAYPDLLLHPRGLYEFAIGGLLRRRYLPSSHFVLLASPPG